MGDQATDVARGNGERRRHDGGAGRATAGSAGLAVEGHARQGRTLGCFLFNTAGDLVLLLPAICVLFRSLPLHVLS